MAYFSVVGPGLLGSIVSTVNQTVSHSKENNSVGVGDVSDLKSIREGSETFNIRDVADSFGMYEGGFLPVSDKHVTNTLSVRISNDYHFACVSWSVNVDAG